MPKRLTDTNKWDEPMFSALEPKMKLVWIYLNDKCDHAGIAILNTKVISFMIGTKITQEEIAQSFGNNVVICGQKILLKPFFKFHYGTAREQVSRSYLSAKQKIDDFFNAYFLNTENEPIDNLAKVNKIEYLMHFDPSKNETKKKEVASPQVPVQDKDQDQDKDSSFEKGMQGEKLLKHFLANLWNLHCGGLSKVTTLTAKRLARCQAREKEQPQESYWLKVFENINASDFLSGRKTDFKVTFDWIIANSTNHVKVYEGQYGSAQSSLQRKGVWL